MYNSRVVMTRLRGSNNTDMTGVISIRFPFPPFADDTPSSRSHQATAGDLCRAITCLQSAVRLHTAGGIEAEMTAEGMQEIAGVVPDRVARGVEGWMGRKRMEMDVNERAVRKKGFDEVRAKVEELTM